MMSLKYDNDSSNDVISRGIFNIYKLESEEEMKKYNSYSCVRVDLPQVYFQDMVNDERQRESRSLCLRLFSNSRHDFPRFSVIIHRILEIDLWQV